MKRQMQWVLLILFLLVPIQAWAQNCCKCVGTCTKTQCVDVTSITSCIDYCAKQGAACTTGRYLGGSTCAKDCARRVKKGGK